jgi:hypothetical protein
MIIVRQLEQRYYMSIINNVKEIADLVQKAGDIELYRKIIELEGELIELTRSNRELEKQS